MNKPNFFIVGAPKAGTTSLYHYLDQHPEVFMSQIKETNFFSIEEIKSQGLFYNEEKIKSLDQYLNLFKDVSNQKAIGEASVSYLFYNSVPTKIYKFNPESGFHKALKDDLSDNLFLGKYLLELHAGCWQRREVLMIARIILRKTIDFRLNGKPLHSRRLYRSFLAS